jgi:Asp-tRNA(Asn)/Glu-tRNA(Gln) amidotransferase A subunit family amidase
VDGSADAALGTDSGGSVRIPAACCGIVGFKPTFGLVPIDGCFPLAPSFDHVGPMARDVATCERMMEVLAEDFAPAAAPDLRELAVGVAWTADADPLVRRRVEAVAARLPGARPVELARAADTDAVFLRDAGEVHAPLWSEHSERYGANVAVKVRRALEVEDAAVEEARRARERHRERFAELMEGIDLLLTPTLVTVAPPAGIGDLALRERLIRLTYPFNLVGAPALAMPCGPAEDGLPASAQIVGRPGEDAFVLAAGRAIEDLRLRG